MTQARPSSINQTVDVLRDFPSSLALLMKNSPVHRAETIAA